MLVDMNRMHLVQRKCMSFLYIVYPRGSCKFFQCRNSCVTLELEEQHRGCSGYNRLFETFKPKNIHLRTHSRRAKRHSKTKDHYSILKISPTATQSQIKTAYYRLCLIYHPDKNKGTNESKEKFAAINEAYKVLHDNISRKRYDRTLAKFNTHVGDEVHFKFKPIQKQNSYDEWTRAHYGNAFQHDKILNRNHQEFLKRKKSLEKQKILNRRVIPAITILSLMMLFAIWLE